MIQERIKMRVLQDNVLDEVKEELDKQFKKWGVQIKPNYEWSQIEMEELGEVCTANLDKTYKEQREEWIQVAAVAIAAIASLDYQG